MSPQHARNMLRPTMLRYVALKCCDRLAGALLNVFKTYLTRLAYSAMRLVSIGALGTTIRTIYRTLKVLR